MSITCSCSSSLYHSLQCSLFNFLYITFRHHYANLSISSFLQTYSLLPSLFSSIKSNRSLAALYKSSFILFNFTSIPFSCLHSHVYRNVLSTTSSFLKTSKNASISLWSELVYFSEYELGFLDST